MQPYRPRPVHFDGVRRHGGWRLKLHSIHLPGETLDTDDRERAVAAALGALPEPDPAAGRPGVGLLIYHQGATTRYLILGWWDRENELPTRVLVREEGSGEGWRPARGGESFCVWDLEVMWRERQAYVATVLAEEPADDALERYLAAG